MKNNQPVTQRNIDYAKDLLLISTTDLKGTITYVNKDFIQVSGFAEEELVGASHNVVRHPDMPVAAFKDLWDTIKAGNTWRQLVKNRCKNGDHYWVDAFATPVYEQDRLVGFQSVRTKPTEEQIRSAERLYAQLNREPSASIPRHRSFFNIPLKWILFVGFGVLLLLQLALLGINIKESDSIVSTVQHETEQRVQIQQAWAAATQNMPQPLPPEIKGFEAKLTQIGKSNGWAQAVVAGGQRAFISTLSIMLALVVVTVSLYILILNLLIRPLSQVGRQIKLMAAGQLRQTIDVAGNNEIGQLSEAAKLLQARLGTIFGQFTESAQSLTASSGHLSASGNTALQGMENQSSETEQVAAAMNEMTATVQEVARSAADAAVAVQSADEETRNGYSKVEQTHQAISLLVEKNENTAKVIEQLRQDGDAINSITNLISSIADQTNLLALNAAIEAARAGEHGRGFAVVADEVRSLAAKTQQSTLQINDMINHLREGITEAVKAMDSGRDQMGAVKAHADETEQSLKQINASIQQIDVMSTQIATATEEQSAVAEEMNRNISSISRQTEMTTENSKEIAVQGDKLAVMAGNLQKLLAQFRIDRN
ncbi:MAG: PAS domain-containing methyl-accepting chemotaxis protein [Halothiobacillus sp.]|nr:PAS domain-containing methyl-accepting chemotaxis protein [Halothiobacillus sp.]